MFYTKGFSQCENLIRYLDNYPYITQLIARQVLGIERLASRVHDLKNDGYDIMATRHRDMSGKRYTRYAFVDTVK